MRVFEIFPAGLIAAVCFLVAESASANTNEIHLDVLLTGQGNFTNASIIRHNPAYAVVDYPGGIINVADSNLPPDLQKQFGYSPANADSFLKQEKASQKAVYDQFAAQHAAAAAYLASLNGTNRIIRITSIGDEIRILQVAATIDGRDQEILIRNLPSSVRDFVNRYNQLQANVPAFAEKVQYDTKAADRADTLASVVRGRDRGYENWAVTRRYRAKLMVLNAKDEGETLQQMQDHLKQMTDDAPQLAAVIAYPSSEFYGTQQVWVCTGVP